MTSEPDPGPGKGHNHKVVLVYASYRQALLTSTFRLLHHRSAHDAILRAFLDSAYRTLRHEALAAAQSAGAIPCKEVELPSTFQGLAKLDSAKIIMPYTISLTVLIQVGVVLASRQDFKDAMRGDIPAIWDPESFLTMELLQSTDVTCTLALITKAIEAIKLACWLEALLQSGTSHGATIGKQRVTVRANEDAIDRVTKRARNDGTHFELTLCGLTTAIPCNMALEDVELAGDGAEKCSVLAVERSLIPILSQKDWSELRLKLEGCLQERKIDIKLTKVSDSHKPSPSGRQLHIDLEKLLLSPDRGRSQVHFQATLELLQQHLAGSRVFAQRVELLLLGGAVDDTCALTAARSFESLQMPYVPVKLLHLLYPKDSHRFGDEPVPLSKVQGNPCQQIAIVGMSCRVPGANDADELWRLLEEGKDMCEEVSRLLSFRCHHPPPRRLGPLTDIPPLADSIDSSEALPLPRLPLHVVPRPKRHAR